MNRALFVTALCLSGAVLSQAASISILNFGFESVTLANPDDYYANNIPGWVTTIDSSTFRPSSTEYPGGVTQGVNVAAVTNSDSIYQVLSATLLADTTYTLLVDVGNRPGFFNGYTISLSAGSDVLASDSSLTPASGTFQTSTITFHALAGNPDIGQFLKITLADGTGSGQQVNYDNVRLDAVTGPEPATFALLGTGLAGLVLYRRKRQIR